jgi:hypothetical protein
MSKNLLFHAPILTFQINDQKRREFKQLLRHPPTIFCAGSGLQLMNRRTNQQPSPAQMGYN